MNDIFAHPVFRAAVWAVAGVGFFLVVSLIAPAIRTALTDARLGIASLRERLSAWAERVTGVRWSTFWNDRSAEPLEPMLAGLSRLDGAARNLGRDQITSLHRLEGRLTDHVRLLRAATAPDAVATPKDRERIARAVGGGGLGTIFTLFLLAIALGGINAALLSVFFREFIGARSPVPTLLPELQMGHVLAILFFILEVASGWLIFRSSGPKVEAGELQPKRSAPELIFLGIAWFLLASLAIIETVAYAVLSARFNIPQQLAIGPDSPFYGITRFFFALFGLAITGALAGIGHALGDAIHQRQRSRIEKRLLRALERRDETLVTTVERVRDSVVLIQKAATELPTSVAKSFEKELGLSQPYPGAPQRLHAAAVSVVSSIDPIMAPTLLAPGVEAPPIPRIRSRTQVLADLGVQLAVVAVLAVVGWLTALEVVAWTSQQSALLAPTLAWAAGIALPAALIGIGLLGRGALFRLRYASPVEQALGGDRGRQVFGYVVGAVALGLAFVTSLLAVTVGVLGEGIILNALLGFFQAGVLLIAGGFLDSALAAVTHVGYLIGLGGVRFLAFLLSVFGLVIEGVLAVVEFIVRLLAIPGETLRRIRTRHAPSASTSASAP